MNGLNLHSGGNAVSVQELALLPVPEATRTWAPIPHIDLLEQVQDSLIRTGYRIIDETHAIHGERYFGLMDLKSDYQDRTTTIGLRNSHDQSFPIGFAVGNHVFVCSNLSFSGEITFKRKHTRFAMRDLPLLVNAAVSRIGAFEASQDARIHAYKHTTLTVDQADHAIMSALRAQVVPGSAIPKVLEEYLRPQHEEFTKDGDTVWRLFNAFTEHLKNSLWMLPKRTMALHAVLDQFCRMPIEGEIVNPMFA